ncbi:hypothetical protein HXX76_012523 [Chlamydomonas incerta]|uniref:SAM-dependent MTase RsmB/NOP-type domain-containing protein n=1 Tax=Chlamydomonas incerta TaxID=51695 RepID=A0A835SHL9_CHLIN|nr:hypothetical protein HXX76_012523 [Chlamydomonas incerta]|eukprot:KAG2427328.1 hypothetical protein HXX76_012523 [Chlamydomonas incerta]
MEPAGAEPLLKEFAPKVAWDPEVEAYLRGALGDERFERTAAALCRPPRTTSFRVNTLRASPSEVVAAVRQQLGPEAAEGVVSIHPQVPCVVLLRGSGPHAVDYGAAGGREVVVSRKAAEAVLRGAPVYAPGVLAASGGVGRGDLVALAAALERPGTDTPEITRGTTLYDSARAAAAAATAAGSAAAGGSDAAATVAAAAPAGRATEAADMVSAEVAEAEAACGPQAGQAGAAAAAPAAMEEGNGPQEEGEAGAAAGADAGSRDGTATASTSAVARPAEAGAAPGGAETLSLRARRRQRHRQHQQQLQQGGPGAPEQLRHKGRQQAGPAGPAAAPAAAIGTGTRAAAGAPDSSGGAGAQQPLPLPPGWTASSQGPVPPRTGLYVGLARAVMGRQEMFRAREGLALELVQPVFAVPPAVSGLPPGWGMLQNLPSVVAALVLAAPVPVPGRVSEGPGGQLPGGGLRPGLAAGMRVLDMCAAPGGKTTLIAALMGDVGEVVAFDRTHAKVGEVVALAREMGVTCVTAQKMDAGRALALPAAAGRPVGGGAADAGADADAEEAAGPERSQQLQQQPGPQPVSEKARRREERRRANMLKRGIVPPEPAAAAAGQPGSFPPESFDALLLDAPCSALGLRPRLQQQAGALYLRQCAAAQRRLVDGAVRLLRPGGAMVYSTCTINPGENEAVVRYLLDKYGAAMQLVAAGPPFLGGPGLVGRHPTAAEPGVPATAAAGAAGAAAGGHAGTGGGSGDGADSGGERWLTEAEAALVQRFDPAAGAGAGGGDDVAADHIGFFVAKFVKTGPVPWES